MEFWLLMLLFTGRCFYWTNFVQLGVMSDAGAAKLKTKASKRGLTPFILKSIGHEAAPTFFWGGQAARAKAVHR
ncbi:MAG: hypothetical protein Q8R95_02730 [Azonexus sp.]|nr:hypothetical protein [Azonexus sp.]